jgi:hypothetical protein
LTTWLEEQEKPHTAALRREKIDALPIPAEQKQIAAGAAGLGGGQEAVREARESSRDLGR